MHLLRGYGLPRWGGIAGPVVAEAVFQNREEVAVRALYRDPVHDFGFFRFDPAQIRFMQVGPEQLGAHL